MRLSQSELQRTSTGVYISNAAPAPRMRHARNTSILITPQCLRSRTPRRHPHLPRHNCRNAHSRAPHRRQQERSPRADHHNRPRTATPAQLDTRQRQDPKDRRAVISARQRNMLQRPCRPCTPGYRARDGGDNSRCAGRRGVQADNCG